MHRLHNFPLVYRLSITLVFASVIVALSVAPGVEKPDDTVFSWLIVNTATPIQKAGHIVVYAILSLLSMWTLDFVESRFLRTLSGLVFVVGLGVVLEWHQLQVPGRFGTVSDVLLNSFGASLGLIFALFVSVTRHRNHT